MKTRVVMRVEKKCGFYVGARKRVGAQSGLVFFPRGQAFQPLWKQPSKSAGFDPGWLSKATTSDENEIAISLLFTLGVTARPSRISPT
jgi:hypothetical protein